MFREIVRREPLIECPAQLPAGSKLNFRTPDTELLVSISGDQQGDRNGPAAMVRIEGIGLKPAGSKLKVGDVFNASRNDLFHF